MAKFLIKAAYTAEGIKGLLKEGGSKRKSTVEKLVESLGGKVEVFYYSFGEHDAYVISDLPDVTTASALSLAINATGLVNVSTTLLIDPADIDAAASIKVGYRAPGQ
jgi:uncharacterized protein with GYD domain